MRMTAHVIIVVLVLLPTSSSPSPSPLLLQRWRHGGPMVKARLESGPDQVIVLFSWGNTFYSHSASLQPGV